MWSERYRLEWKIENKIVLERFYWCSFNCGHNPYLRVWLHDEVSSQGSGGIVGCPGGQWWWWLPLPLWWEWLLRWWWWSDPGRITKLPPPLLQLLFSDPGDSTMKRDRRTLAAFSAVRRFSFALSISALTSSSSCPVWPVKPGAEAEVAGIVVEVVVVAKISAEVVVVVVVEVASRCWSVETLFILLFEDEITTDVHDDINEKYQRVSIICGNCSTIHALEDNANEK